MYGVAVAVSRRVVVLHGACMLPRAGDVLQPRVPPLEEDRWRAGRRGAAATVFVGIFGAKRLPTHSSKGGTKTQACRHPSQHLYRRVSGRNQARNE